MNKWIPVIASSLFALECAHAVASNDQPLPPALLVIGASYGDGTMPFNDAGEAPLGGASIGFGSYLSLGQALTREPTLPGFVINEAQAGATTFSRTSCNPVCQQGVGWLGYGEQLARALARVTTYDPNTGQAQVNASHVIITFANDCLHADAFGVPQSETQPCSLAEVDAFIDRLIAVGHQALSVGVKPVYEVMPRWEDLDLPYAGQLFGILWMLDQSGYESLRARHRDRLITEMPDALVLDYWAGFVHIGDGIHPDPQTAKRAAHRIAQAVRRHGR